MSKHVSKQIDSKTLYLFDIHDQLREIDLHIRPAHNEISREITQIYNNLVKYGKR